jgi:general stress protein 26
MTTLNGQEDRGDVLWFFMSKNGEPVVDIARNADVNVAYGNPETNTYVSVSGAARLVDDMAKKKAFWSPVAQAWFGAGVNDPEVALVAVTIEQAEYWDAHENRATKLYEMTKAAMSGGRPDIGEHREMRTR